MKIHNPNYVDPVLKRADELTVQIEAYFTNNPTVGHITSDQIRARFPAVANELTNGMIAQICQGKSWKTSE